MTNSAVGPQQPSSQSPAGSQPTTQLRKRDRYIDSLRALALIRVMTYHVFDWVWLPILFPSIGIMFALAGSLIASSLDRSPGNPWRVLKKRSIRLLPPVWLFGLVVVPFMLVAGWTSSQTAGDPLNWRTLLFWVLPISDPPASSFGYDWVIPLWYIRSYLWFLLLSPAALWLFRHWPKRMMALPVTVVLLSTIGLLPLEGRSGDVILSISVFGGCWMLGFAHHDNKIRSLPLVKVLLGGASLMALGLLWAFTHPDPVTASDIDNIPVANAFYCLGAVLILLRLYPDFSWMEKRSVLDKLITVINMRAMTIYLWGNFAIFLANPTLDSWSVTASLDQDDTVGYLLTYLTSWVLVIAAVFMFGWCEDLAARRPPRLNPWPDTTPPLNLGQGKGRILQLSGSATKLKSAVAEKGKFIKPLLVRAAHPWRSRGGEKHASAEQPGDLGVTGHLAALVPRQAEPPIRRHRHQCGLKSGDALVDPMTIGQIDQPKVPGAAIDQGDHRRLAHRPDNQIPFNVTQQSAS